MTHVYCDVRVGSRRARGGKHFESVVNVELVVGQGVWGLAEPQVQKSWHNIPVEFSWHHQLEVEIEELKEGLE